VGKQLLQEKEELYKIICTLVKKSNGRHILPDYLDINSYWDLC